MADSGCSVPISNLLCHEDGACLDVEEETDSDGIVDFVLFPSDPALDDEYIGVLVTREGSFGGGLGAGSRDGYVAADWFDFARCEAVRWIMRTRDRFGFGFQTAYLAVNYLDRFFLKRTIERRQCWAIHLLSVACLSLAAKLEECRVPALSDFLVEGYHFDTNSIQRMELLVLTTLGWRLRSVTPFPYLRYLVSRFGCDVRQEELLFMAKDLVFAAVETMNLVDYCSSTIAVASFFSASGRELTKKVLESDMGIISSCGSLVAEHVISCYNLIEEARKKKKMMMMKINNSPLSSPSTGIDDLADNSNLISISSKRRRLALSAYSCHCLISNKSNSE